MSDEKICFVISPIGEEGSETRDRSDAVFEDVIKDVVEEFGYTPKRSDHIKVPGQITNQIVEYVVESPLVIADLTNKNPNVFYELAVRHAHEKPVIQLINREQNIPFDVGTQRTINIDLSDFVTTNQAQEKIRDQIAEIEADDFEVENPVSVANNIRQLKESGEPEKQQLAELTEVLNDINSKMHSIEREIDDPEELLPPDYLEEVFTDWEGSQFEHIVRNLYGIEENLESIENFLREEGFEEHTIMKEIQHARHLTQRTIEDL